MKRNRSKKPPKSAAELMVELNADAAFVERTRLRDRQHAERVDSNRLAAAPILRELRQAGIDYRAAIPVLLRWLPKIENDDVKADIVRSLSVPWAVPEAAPALIMEFLKATAQQSGGLRWAIANGLAVTADNAVLDQLVTLVTDRRYGRDREMLALALGNCQDPRAVEVLLALLADEQVAGHAVMALGNLRSETARPHIQEFLKHPKRWVRTEATNALKRIDGRSPRRCWPRNS